LEFGAVWPFAPFQRRGGDPAAASTDRRSIQLRIRNQLGGSGLRRPRLRRHGLEKFPAGPGYWVSVFDSIGLGQWFRYFTGIVEVVGGLLFLVPGVTAVGAALLAAAMIGAMVVHIVVFKQPANILFPGAYLVGVVLAFAKLRASRRRRTPHE
jgi:hypothetical protein